jgi:CDP-diacylglycerol--glycerol-3-phosphate 3-phosphatidyltransferase
MKWLALPSTLPRSLAPTGRWIAQQAANLLTILRLLLVVPVVVLLLGDTPLARLSAALLFLAAGLTDLLDGYLARRTHQTSALGAFLDQIADKLLVDAVLVTLALRGEVPWLLAAFFLGRDAGITLLRSRSPSRQTQLRSSPLAKYKTAILMAGVTLLLLGTAATGTVRTLLTGLAWGFIGLAVLLTAASMVEYVIRILGRRAPADGASQ